MILDNLENASNYFGLNPLFKKAFEYAGGLDMSNAPEGFVEIEGIYLKASVADTALKSKAESKLETHRKFIDIQIPIAGEEIFGWKSLKNLKEATGEYSRQNDFQLFNDEPSAFINVLPGEFIIFFPEDAHAPLIGEGTTRKLIIKVAVL
ncbi:hypothetical protein SDC9_79231 [bioreactor metagenome]|uniref:Toxin-antitoxin biofilm protein TabA n=1 Tax=bioreactor metagenome TaxID=1076179 RepID=A0A644YVU0_9ZZZZ